MKGTFRHMALADDLTDLVDNPSETLAVEYKSEFDLSNPRSKANFARHVAALANYGGGYLVFGFNNDLTSAAKTEFSALDRDTIAGIVRSYLDPPLQCDVRVVTARSGARHTIVVVPSHGSVPVCAQRDGPQDTKGRPQGILSGAYYIRKPGPASESIVTPSEWAPLIRRCALAERAAILSAIDVALKGGRSEDGIERRLRKWHDALPRSYSERLTAAGRAATLAHGYVQFSFAVHQSGEAITHDELARVVERCNAEADAITRMHWGPFVVIHRDPIAPRSRTASDLDNGEREFLEAAVVEPGDATHASDMWRVSGEGLASLINGWWEDTPYFKTTPQTCLSPTWFAKEIAGCVLFARAFANSFETATAVTFRCEWTGLKGRRPFDRSAPWYFSGPSEDERRVSTATISLAEMNNGWEAPTAKLAGPVARAIGLGHVLTAGWFANQASWWAGQH
jgi:hypothetical protein